MGGTKTITTMNRTWEMATTSAWICLIGKNGKKQRNNSPWKILKALLAPKIRKSSKRANPNNPGRSGLRIQVTNRQQHLPDALCGVPLAEVAWRCQKRRSWLQLASRRSTRAQTETKKGWTKRCVVVLFFLFVCPKKKNGETPSLFFFRCKSFRPFSQKETRIVEKRQPLVEVVLCQQAFSLNFIQYQIKHHTTCHLVESHSQTSDTYFLKVLSKKTPPTLRLENIGKPTRKQPELHVPLRLLNCHFAEVFPQPCGRPTGNT